MNYKRACDILDIPNDLFCQTTLKRQYRVKALLYHPDKNKSDNATIQFQQVTSAYEYLLKYEGYMDEDGSDCEVDENGDSNIVYEKVGKYKDLLSSFIKNIVVGETHSQLFSIILTRISGVCEATALDTLKKLDRQMLLRVYEIIRKYGTSMHFGEGFIQKIEAIISDRMNADERIILNPTLDDLFDNNLYRLTVNKQIYIVPLWHNELVYDNSNNDIYVNCNPMLPDNIEIDEKNNVKMQVSYKISDIWNVDTLQIQVGTQRTVPIRPSQLKLVPEQTVVFANMGISRINVKDVYDIKQKSDLHIQITLEM
jgi:hypothetical protein